MSGWTPQKLRDLISSSMFVTTWPDLDLSTNLTQFGSEPYLLSTFSLRARTVIKGSTLSSGIFKLERLCSRFILIVCCCAIFFQNQLLQSIFQNPLYRSFFISYYSLIKQISQYLFIADTLIFFKRDIKIHQIASITHRKANKVKNIQLLKTRNISFKSNNIQNQRTPITIKQAQIQQIGKVLQFYCTNYIEQMKNKGIQQTQLNVSIGTDNNSMLSNHTSKQMKQTYTEYISRFGVDIDYNSSTATQLENSLTEMRIVLKQLNVMLNKMMDKNYQYLAQREHVINSPDKEVEILKAQIENVKKLATNQDSQITNLNNTLYEMEGKQSYEQELLDQIYEIKKKMPHVELQSKSNIGNINKNGYVLINQEQDTSLYFRVNLLRNDLDRAYERLRKFQEKYNAVVEKERELEERNYEICEKFDKSVSFARQNSMDVTTNGSIISFKDRYDTLLKKKQQQMKKSALQEHVGKNNEVVLQKKISDMKKLLNQYSIKEQQFTKRISDIQRQCANLLQKSNVLNKMAQKSFSFRYAEVLLKGDKAQKQKVNGKNKNKGIDDYEDDFQQLQENKNTSRIVSKSNNLKQKEQSNYQYKPSLNSVRKKNQLGQNVYEKSMSLVEIPSKNKNKNSNFSFEDQIKEEQIKSKNPTFHIRRSSANQIAKKNDQRQSKLIPDKTPESPIVKHWKDDNKNQNAKNNLQGEYKISKPLLNLKRKVNNTSAIQSYQKDKNSKKNIKEDLDDLQGIQPKFSRLTQKKTGNKMTDEYMTYLQDKGRKILGLN